MELCFLCGLEDQTEDGEEDAVACVAGRQTDESGLGVCPRASGPFQADCLACSACFMCVHLGVTLGI